MPIWMKVATCFLATSTCVFAYGPEQSSNVKAKILIEPDVLGSWITNKVPITIVDLRDDLAENDKGIVGCVSAPANGWRFAKDLTWTEEEQHKLESMIRDLGISKNSRVVLYGSKSIDVADGFVWAILRAAGVDDVKVLRGGWNRWSIERSNETTPIDLSERTASKFTLSQTFGNWGEIGHIIDELNSPNRLDLSIGEFWVLFCTALVFFMQAGFLCIEAGLVQSKHSIDSALKNLTDFLVVGFVYWAVGYSLMFGTTNQGLVGQLDHLFFVDEVPGYHWPTIFFLFQLVYCATAMTIASGAVAERMRFIPYVCIAIFVGGLVYPIFGHLVWAGLNADPFKTNFTADPKGILATFGFRDFAGATTVHSLGGWVALVSVIFLRERKREAVSGPSRSFSVGGHSVPMASLGVFILWLGTFGFTAGRTFIPNQQVPQIILNTILSGIGGGITGLFAPLLPQIVQFSLQSIRTARFTPRFIRGISVRALRTLKINARIVFSFHGAMNGTIAGLVAICAGCDVFTGRDAFFVGALSGIVMHWSARWLKKRRWDDPVGAISAHGFGGAWGTIAIPIFTDEVGFAPQVAGIVCCVGWTVGTMSVFFAVLGSFTGINPAKWQPWFSKRWWVQCRRRLRPRKREEQQGMNITEHATTTELHNYLMALTEETRLAVRNSSTRGKVDLPSEPEMMTRIMRSIVESQAIEGSVASVTHDVRMYVADMLQFSEAIAQAKRPEEREKATQSLRSAAFSLDGLIANTLDWNQIKRGVIADDSETIELRELIAQLTTQFSIAAADKGRQFTVTPFRDVIWLCTSRHSIERILRNLVANAIEFSRSEVVLTCDCMVDGTFVITVSDDGNGIAESIRDEIWAPYYTNRHDGSGHGLGLANVQHMASKIGARVNSYNKAPPQSGAVFEIVLPKRLDANISTPEARENEGRAVATDQIYSQEFEHPGDFVLVVDDRLRSVEHLMTELGSQGIRTEGRETMPAGVVSALSLWFDGRMPTCLLADIRIGADSGLDMSRMLRSAGYPGVIIGITFNQMADQVVKDAGMDAWIDKGSIGAELVHRRYRQILQRNQERIAIPADRMFSAFAYNENEQPRVREFSQLASERIVEVRRAVEARTNATMATHNTAGAFDKAGFFQLSRIFDEILTGIEEEDWGRCGTLLDEAEARIVGISSDPSPLYALLNCHNPPKDMPNRFN